MPSITLDWVQLAAAAGALQGVFLAGVLTTHPTNQSANRLLAALMVAFTVFLAGGVYYATVLFQRFPYFFGVSYQMPFVFGPLVYLYARAASDRAWRFQRRHWVHFIPVIVSTLLAAPYYVMSGAEKIALYERLQRGDVPSLIAVFDPVNSCPA